MHTYITCTKTSTHTYILEYICTYVYCETHTQSAARVAQHSKPKRTNVLPSSTSHRRRTAGRFILCTFTCVCVCTCMSVSAPTVDWVRGRECASAVRMTWRCAERGRGRRIAVREKDKKKTEKPALARRGLHTLLHLCSKLWLSNSLL